MQKFAAIVFGALIFIGGAEFVRADGCYMCKGGGYVKYRGSDTFKKRKEAKKKCNCTVTGTTSSCANPKCTVSVISFRMRPLFGKDGWDIKVYLDKCR